MNSDSDRNVVLTGFMATGKTTVGQALAQLMDRAFVDADEEIVRRAGISIPQIFERDGEQGFRALEREVCMDLSSARGLVIATGGGMLVDPENRRRMLDTGLVVCLDAPKAVIGTRLSASQDRPLAGDWAALFDKRRAAYAAIPVHIDTQGKTPETIAQEILILWHNDSP